jgi:hypothetical protein
MKPNVYVSMSDKISSGNHGKKMSYAGNVGRSTVGPASDAIAKSWRAYDKADHRKSPSRSKSLMSAGSRRASVEEPKGTWTDAEVDIIKTPIMRKRSGKAGTSIFSMDVDPNTVMDDLLGLGIKLDKGRVERMQKSLNTRSNLETARRLAAKKRAVVEGKLSHYDYEKESTNAYDDLQVSRSFASTYSAHKGFMPLNSKRVAEIVRDIDNRTGALKASSRKIMFKIIDTLQVEYKRQADDFLLKLLDIPPTISKRQMAKNKGYVKTLLEDDSKRYLDLTSFMTGILNILPSANQSDIVMLFSLLSERMRQMDEDGRVWVMIVCVDVVGFLCLLTNASHEQRRSFANSNSKVSNDVEFWSDKRHKVFNKPTNHPTVAKGVPNFSNRNMSMRPREEFGTLGGKAESTNEKFDDLLKTWNEIEDRSRHRRTAVPDLLGSPRHSHSGKSYGALNKEITHDRSVYSVEHALASPRKSPAKPARHSHLTMEKEQIQKKHPKLYDTIELIKKQGHDGVGVAAVLGASPSTAKAKVEKLKNGYQKLQNEEQNSTTVAAALGKSEDMVGRGVRWENAVLKREARESGYALSSPPDINTTPSEVTTSSSDAKENIYSKSNTVTGASEPSSVTIASVSPTVSNMSPMAKEDPSQSISTNKPSPSPLRSKSAPSRHAALRGDGDDPRFVSYGSFSRDTVSNSSNYSVAKALVSPREHQPTKGSYTFLETEQYQKKKDHLNNRNHIAYMANKGVGVFQALSYQVTSPK